jgi:hypothetical protein
LKAVRWSKCPNLRAVSLHPARPPPSCQTRNDRRRRHDHGFLGSVQAARLARRLFLVLPNRMRPAPTTGLVVRWVCLASGTGAATTSAAGVHGEAGEADWAMLAVAASLRRGNAPLLRRVPRNFRIEHSANGKPAVDRTTDRWGAPTLSARATTVDVVASARRSCAAASSSGRCPDVRHGVPRVTSRHRILSRDMARPARHCSSRPECGPPPQRGSGQTASRSGPTICRWGAGVELVERGVFGLGGSSAAESRRGARRLEVRLGRVNALMAEHPLHHANVARVAAQLGRDMADSARRCRKLARWSSARVAEPRTEMGHGSATPARRRSTR